MPIPELDQHGLLPPGVHVCTMGEIADRFGGDSGGARREIFNGLTRWRSLLVRTGLPIEIFVDGSFTTDKPVPKDVDVALRLPSPTRAFMSMVARNARLFDPDVAKPEFLVDPWYFYDKESGPDPMDYIGFFSTLRLEEARRRGLAPTHNRGILKVGP